MAFFSRPSSSAVKIVAPVPSTSEPSSPPPKASKKDSTQRQCRNILIYGSCKFQDKGCIYYHPPRDTSSPGPPDSPTPRAALPAQAVNAPIFVPKNPGSPAPAIANYHFTSSTSPPLNEMHTYSQDDEEVYDPEAYQVVDDLADQFQAMDNGINPYADPGDGIMDYDLSNPMDLFYTGQASFVREPLNYHLYTQPRPENLQHKYFVSDKIREELQKRSESIYITPPPGLDLPEETQGYHSLVPLEPVVGERHNFSNWHSTVYKATNFMDGFPYVMRRIENFRLISESALSGIKAWSRIRHPNLVTVKEAFTTLAFNDNSLMVVYDYHPNSETLNEAHLKSKAPQFINGRLQTQNARMAERTIWSYVIQIASVLKTVHEAGLAVRVVDDNKILVTSKNRVRIGSCGIVDILMHEARQDMALLQQEDLSMLGGLIFKLCCNDVAAMNNLPKAVECLGRHYSAELKNVALFLISNPGPHKSIRQLFDMIGSQIIMELDESQNAVDRLESEMASELENGRLVRLLSKFGFINERPEFARDPRWSETGDRYIIKLFRDYVFHQVDEHGRPVINMSHVLTCLNKLDAGIDERIMLVSRDEQSCLVVSYREIKSCIDSAFSELSVGFGSVR